MSHPHVEQRYRDLLDDFGLIDQPPAGDDSETENTPGRCWNTAEGSRTTYPAMNRSSRP